MHRAANDDVVRRRRIERFADLAFLGALGVMTARCVVIAVEFVQINEAATEKGGATWRRGATASWK